MAAAKAEKDKERAATQLTQLTVTETYKDSNPTATTARKRKN